MPWYGYALAAAVAASLAVIAEKFTLRREHAMQFSASLAIVNALITLPALFVFNLSLLNLNILALIYAASLLGTLAFLFVAKSIRHMDVSTASPMIALGPVASTTFAFFILGERLSTEDLFGLVLVVLGVYALHSVVHDRSKRAKHYAILIAGSIVLYGLSSVIDRFMVHSVGLEPIVYLALTQLFIAINFLILSSFMYGMGETRTAFKSFGGAIVLVALLTVTYRFFQMEAVSQANVGLVEALKKSSTLITILLAGEIFHEKNIFRKFTAAILIIAGVALIIV